MGVFNDFIGWLGKKMLRNAALGPFATIGFSFRDIDRVNKGFGSGNDVVDSWLNAQTQAGPTGRDLWLANREDTVNQRSVADLQAAGLNPALMYNGGASQVPVSSASSGNTAGLSDILQLVMLPLQMKSLQADINKTEADTQNTLANTRGVEISNDWIALLNESEINARNANTDLSRAEIDKVYTDIGRAREEIELIKARTKSEVYKQQLDMANSYLSLTNANKVNSLLSYEQALLEAQADYQNASAQFALVEKLYKTKLIDGGYIDAVIRSAKANVTLDEVEAWLSSDQFGRENESGFERFLHSAIAGLNTAVKIISPIKSSRSSNVEVNKNVTVHK